jgi:hypothetical protein
MPAAPLGWMGIPSGFVKGVRIIPIGFQLVIFYSCASVTMQIKTALLVNLVR